MSVISERDNMLFADLKDWKPIPRLARVIPFGYEVDPEDNNMLLPIPFQLEALAKAKKHLKNYSYRYVAEWLSEVTGRYISHVGLKKRVEMERTRRTKAGAIKSWITRAEKARKELEYYVETLGAKS